MDETEAARLVALAGHLFDARSIDMRMKKDGGFEAATTEGLKGFRDMVRIVFDDVAAIEAAASDQGSGGFKTLKPGFHEVTIKNAKAKTSSNGNEGLWMALHDHEGASATAAIWFTDKTQPNILRFAKAIGCDPQSGVAITLTPESVEGRRLCVTVVEEEYNGELRAVVEYMSWQPSAMPNPAWKDEPAPKVVPVVDSEIPF